MVWLVGEYAKEGAALLVNPYEYYDWDLNFHSLWFRQDCQRKENCELKQELDTIHK